MRFRVPSRVSIYVDGAETSIEPRRLFLGGALLTQFAPRTSVPGELPYLFCGNGSCRDCNLQVEGIDDVPSCRVPLAPGVSVRRGMGAGEDDALSRKLPAPDEPDEMEPWVCDVLVIGGGRSGRAAAKAHQDRGRRVMVVEARSPSRQSAAVVDGRLVVFEGGRRRTVMASETVLATGRRDVCPDVPGVSLPGVLSLELMERYAGLGYVPDGRLALVGEEERVEKLSRTAQSLGARSVMRGRALDAVAGRDAVEAVVADGRERPVDWVAVSAGRVPSLALAKALGCRTRYDRRRGAEVLVLDDDGRTSVKGVHAVGSVARP